jgi:hypothetical protein
VMVLAQYRYVVLLSMLLQVVAASLQSLAQLLDGDGGVLCGQLQRCRRRFVRRRCGTCARSETTRAQGTGESRPSTAATRFEAQSARLPILSGRLPSRDSTIYNIYSIALLRSRRRDRDGRPSTRAAQAGMRPAAQRAVP